MKEQVLALVRALCRPTLEDEALGALCETACEKLDGLLADGVTAEDCAREYQLAAAWTVMAWMEAGRGWEGVTSLSAGDMTVRRDGGEGRLEERALALMRPYLRDQGFVFQGVRG